MIIGIVTAEVTRPGGLETYFVEQIPEQHQEDLITKCFLNGNSRIIPINVATLNGNKETFKKGQITGICQQVMRIARVEKNVPTILYIKNSVKATNTWEHLTESGMLKADFLKVEQHLYEWKNSWLNRPDRSETDQKSII